MTFLLDEDLSPEVAEIARNLGADVESVHDLGRRGLSDREQLAYAAAVDRILVTRNRDDFLRLTVELFTTGEPHAGLLIVPRSLPNRRAARLAHALVKWQAERRHPPGSYAVDFLGS